MNDLPSPKNRCVMTPVRIYHEDTDAGGVVYHANYLRYMERARTDWLTEKGWDHNYLADEYNMGFVVRSITLKYFKPARLGQNLEVFACFESYRHGLLTFNQKVVSQSIVLVQGTVVVVAIDLQQFQRRGLPEELIQMIGELA
jgi:acyl-CoA thioester hydrolase